MPKRCFVIQGFGEKQDFQTGRTLDLDASYDVIHDAVIEAGLECVRADEIRHSGTIDQPMFEQILSADLVIADLSTNNVNAAYELGVRHALRPFTTIIVAESGFKYPFDFSHIAIRRYEHLGKDIGRREAERFTEDLKQAITAILPKEQTDSPVYTFLPKLEPPELQAGVVPPAPAAAAVRGAPVTAAGEEESVKAMRDRARAALDTEDFVTAKELLRGLLVLEREARGPDEGRSPNEERTLQQLALATYKSRQPSPMMALIEARGYLNELDPTISHDPETLGLWGAVHKRMWDLTGDRVNLDEAIAGYERGFQLKQDYYNGINLAFLLNVRAQRSTPADAIADWVLAERVRRRVIVLCQAALDALPAVAEAGREETPAMREQRYWILATLQEAATGIGDEAAAANWSALAAATRPAAWMTQSTADQIARLRELLAKSPLSVLPAAGQPIAPAP